ncbi:MAG: hypothetical protein V1660_00305 [archaeon]
MIGRRFLRMMNEKKSIAFSVLVLFVLMLGFFIYFLFSSIYFVTGLSSYNSSLANLTIWDITDSLPRFTYQNCYDTYAGKCLPKSLSEYNIFFYANFTNKSSGAVITPDGGNCSIRFDENLSGVFTGWINMTFSLSRGQYEHNRSFNYKGGIPFEINCTSSTYSNINLSENAAISNSVPAFHAKDAGGNLPNQNIIEDTIFYYNVSLNCSDDDLNDLPDLAFGYIPSETSLTNFTLSAKGNLTVNISTGGDVGSGSKKIMFSCRDSESPIEAANMSFTITAVNDAPIFLNLNDTMNAMENQLFNFTLMAKDEENNFPFYFDATFVNCTTANWSTRNSSNCNLFNLTGWRNSTAITINFTPSNDDVGNYTIEFNVTDLGNTILPYNATRIKTIIFTVINVNDLPNITYLCNNERNATEDSLFSCWITANDTDELYNLTFISNTTWFTFNNSRRIMNDSITINSTVQVNFTANDSMVGVWYIKINVTDSSGGSTQREINFNISNIDDNVSLGSINATYEIFSSAEFYLEINASDDDLRIPSQGKNCSSGYGCYNENITFTRNITGNNATLFNVVKINTSGNFTTAYIRFTPSNSDSGNYTINITVRDANNYSISSRTFNISIYENTVPYWVNLTSFSFDVNDGLNFSLNLSLNATDTENDNITFSNNTGSLNLPHFINSLGSISFYANDSSVGVHNVTISLTDSRGARNSSQNFTFTVHNVNETPVLYPISNMSREEDSTVIALFYCNDEDLDLPSLTENINWSWNSTTAGFTASKVNFTVDNFRQAHIIFAPNKTDVGTHEINITITDTDGRKDSQIFYITVTSVNHPPVLDEIGPRNITVNASFYLDINATDLEDGADNISGPPKFTFASNANWFSISLNNGIINVTLTTSEYVGYNWINISVNDSTNLSDSEVFRLAVYSENLPPFLELALPSSNNTVENCSSNSSVPDSCINFMITVNDPNSGEPNNDTLRIVWSIDGVVNKTLNNAIPGNWSFLYETNFTDEGVHNITVNISDTYNITIMNSWNITVNHSNAPVSFNGKISNISASYPSLVSIEKNLIDGSIEGGGYFSDIDHSDPKYNAPINFTFNVMDENCTNLSTTTAIINVTNDTVKFFASSSKQGATIFCMNISGYDSANSSMYANSTMYANSNNFQVNLTVTSTTEVQVPVSGGGGGGGENTKKVPISLKIIVPEPFSMFTHDRIVVPIKLQNKGKEKLSSIKLYSNATLDGVSTELSTSYFNVMYPGDEKSFDLTILTNTNFTGSYEITVSATVGSPKYSDSASFFVNLIEMGWKEKIKAQEKIVFLEELLIGNPECLELTEILNSARKEYEKNNFEKALKLTEDAIQGCKYAISSKGGAVEVKRKFDFGSFVMILTAALLALLFLIFILHSYQRAKFKKS